MLPAVLDLLCCPSCGGAPLSLAPFMDGPDGHVLEGVLSCAGCTGAYLVTGGIPRMLPGRLYSDPGFVERHRERLRELGWSDTDGFTDDHVALKRATAAAYGFEWNRWNRFGWDAQGATEEERGVFRRKSLLTPDDLGGATVLDAGCGNGRYSFVAAGDARTVVALDLSTSVDAAFANLRHLPNVHVVQGDLMHPPVRPGVIDHVFSIGVLMLTGDARRATAALARLLRPGGTITVHVYAKGFPLWQFDDAVVRAITTRLSLPAMVHVARVMTRVAVFLQRHGWLGYSSLVLRVWPDDTVNFDWYATPQQTYHTLAEVKSWFAAMHFAVVGANDEPVDRVDGPRARVRRWLWRPAMVTVRGRAPVTDSSPR